MEQYLTKIKDFFIEHEAKIMIFIGFCLISAISFEFGVLQGQKWQQKPLVIEKPSTIPEGQESATMANSVAKGTAQVVASQTSAIKTTVAPSMTNCAFVGSKSSNKFYLPTCSYAKRVKPENLVCFKSANEAITQGRTESKCGK